mgnify:CR=1 FL=1
MVYKYEYYFASSPNDIHLFECSADNIHEAQEIFNTFRKTYKENIQVRNIYEVVL